MCLETLLSPLEGTCTYKLLHESRIHLYGENYSTIATTGDNLDGKCESVLALDRASHVPADTPQAETFRGDSHQATGGRHGAVLERAESRLVHWL